MTPTPTQSDSAHAQPELSALLHRLVVDAGVAPGATVALGWLESGAARFATGSAGRTSTTRESSVDPSTPFDLASVTKPFVATTALRLAMRAGLDLDAALSKYVPEATGAPVGAATLDLLFAHRAGLDAHVELFAPLTRGERVEGASALERVFNSVRDDCRGPPPAEGFAAVYSDLGYLLAGVAMERATGQNLDELVREQVLTPVGATSTGSAFELSARDATFRDRVAATEHVSWRGGEIVGVVHDENAWALSRDRASGHAGLFGTAEDVARFGVAVLSALASGGDEFLDDRALHRMLRKRPGGTHRAGFDGRAVEAPSAGSGFGPETFGHLGFTGTSLWCDPEAGLSAALLTNRVCPTRENVRVRAARPAVHDALVEWWCRARVA